MSISIPSAGLTQSRADSRYVKQYGSRGSLGGYENAGSESSIYSSGGDVVYWDGNSFGVEDGADETAWTKVALLTAASPFVTLGTGWSWRGGTAPTISSGDIIVCQWLYDRGIATVIPGARS